MVNQKQIVKEGKSVRDESKMDCSNSKIEALASAAISDDSAWMHQQKLSRDEATRTSENAADAEWMGQCSISRYR